MRDHSFTSPTSHLIHMWNEPCLPLLPSHTASQHFGWRLGVVASVVRRMNEVTVHWAQLVLG